MNILTPPPLRKGDTIGIVAPSSFIESDRLDQGVEILRAHGFDVKIHPQTLMRDRQSAGGIAEKVAALHEMFVDASVHAIFAAGGGNRSAHILGALDYQLIAANPKPYVGFSDSTALLTAMFGRAGLCAFHGPVVKSLPRTDPACLDFLFSLLSGHLRHYPFESSAGLHDGTATGRLMGGNLGVFSALAGTPFMPDPTGAILFLEDIGEELSRVDRMLWHLRHSLPFSRLGGIVFGQFTDLQDSGRPFGFTLEEILREHTAGLDIPVAFNAPFGHGSALYPLPVGAVATLDVSASDVALRLENLAVTA